MTQLIFEAKTVYNWRSRCSIKIERIEIHNGTCPNLGNTFIV